MRVHGDVGVDLVEALVGSGWGWGVEFAVLELFGEEVGAVGESCCWGGDAAMRLGSDGEVLRDRAMDWSPCWVIHLWK